MKEDRTGTTGTSLLICEGGVSWNSYGKSHETGLSPDEEASSMGPVCGCAWLAWLTSGPACSLRGASRTLVTWLA